MLGEFDNAESALAENFGEFEVFELLFLKRRFVFKPTVEFGFELRQFGIVVESWLGHIALLIRRN